MNASFEIVAQKTLVAKLQRDNLNFSVTIILSQVALCNVLHRLNHAFNHLLADVSERGIRSGEETLRNCVLNTLAILSDEFLVVHRERIGHDLSKAANNQYGKFTILVAHGTVL